MPKKNKILLIEDDEFVSKAYKYFLTQAGFKINLARNAAEARKKISLELPDLVLLDLIMPGVNGFELLEEFKDKKVLEKVPVIVVSNLGQESDMAECKKLGAVDYLIKSNFYMKDVIQRVNYHIENFNPKDVNSGQ